MVSILPEYDSCRHNEQVVVAAAVDDDDDGVGDGGGDDDDEGGDDEQEGGPKQKRPVDRIHPHRRPALRPPLPRAPTGYRHRRQMVGETAFRPCPVVVPLSFGFLVPPFFLLLSFWLRVCVSFLA